MDNKTNIQELKELVREFCEDRDWDQFHSAKNLAIGIITESSELLEQFRFKSDQEIESMFKNMKEREKITEEMADVFCFLLRFAQRYNIDLDDELKKKMVKNKNKYPIEKSKSLNKKYTEL